MFMFTSDQTFTTTRFCLQSIITMSFYRNLDILSFQILPEKGKIHNTEQKLFPKTCLCVCTLYRPMVYSCMHWYRGGDNFCFSANTCVHTTAVWYMLVICSNAELCCSEGMLSWLCCASSCESYSTLSPPTFNSQEFLGIKLVETREHLAATKTLNSSFFFYQWKQVLSHKDLNLFALALLVCLSAWMHRV